MITLAEVCRALIPVVRVECPDYVHINKLIAASVDREVRLVQTKPDGRPIRLDSGIVHVYCGAGAQVDWPGVYADALKAQCTIVAVNPGRDHPCMLNLGVLAMPRTLLQTFVAKRATEANVDEVVQALSGLPYGRVVEATKLAGAVYGELTGLAVRAVLRLARTTEVGLIPVSTTALGYVAHPALKDWVTDVGGLMAPDVPEVLRPRGAMFYGAPGTGKTAGAKYVANSLGIPLFMFDLGGLLSKYVGDSDQNLRRALASAERMAPCVLLLDEAEKLFSGQDDTGTQGRMLAYLLWWLQEHTSSVLTIMTTNHLGDVPPELYRPGRLDQCLQFESLPKEKGRAIGLSVAAAIWESGDWTYGDVVSAVDALYTDDDARTPAEITEAVLTLARMKILMKPIY